MSAPAAHDDPRIDELRERLAAVERRLSERTQQDAIRDLLADYARCSDAGYVDAWLALFTDDARIAVHRLPPAGLDEWQGRDALRRLIADPAGHGRLEGRTMHLPALSIVVDIDGVAASAASAACVLAKDDAGATVIHEASFSTWKFRRVDGRWRIAERVRHPLGASVPPSPELRRTS